MTKKKPGRPSLGGSTDNKAIKAVTLDDQTVKTLRQVGNGNLSQGIRLAADLIRPLVTK